MEQTLMDKLTILADSAKYDVACTSSGASRTARAGTVGSCYAPGCCHAFTADGRCVSLLKVLMTNCCSFDCGYCVNRRSNDIPRATFAPRELAELTMEFYRRNYIEGLFLSSAVLGTPDYTTERMLAVLRLLRGEYRFGGYIHAKAIPGTSPELLQQLGYLADRLSVNVELPSERSLNLLAPDKGRHSIFRPMKQIAVSGAASREELTLYRHAPKFAPAGQSTQMIVGASPETDYHILKLTEGMYHKYGLKRVFYSAYIPVAEDTRLSALDCYITSALDASSNYSRCRFVIKKGGVYRLTLKKVNADGETLAEYQTYRTFSYSEEYDNNQEITDLTLTENLQNLAEAANGKLIADDEDPMEVFANFVTSIPKSFDPRYLFMILALVLFLTDVAVRKFKFKWPHEIVRAFRDKRKDKKGGTSS